MTSGFPSVERLTGMSVRELAALYHSLRTLLDALDNQLCHPRNEQSGDSGRLNASGLIIDEIGGCLDPLLEAVIERMADARPTDERERTQRAEILIIEEFRDREIKPGDAEMALVVVIGGPEPEKPEADRRRPH